MLVVRCLVFAVFLTASSPLHAAPPDGILPTAKDGRPLNLDFETGTLKDWTADGDAFNVIAELPGSDPALKDDIKAKVLVLHGADDKFESPEQIAGFQQEMRDAGADWQFLSYGGAVHCFAIPTADGKVPGCKYDARTAKRAFAQMKEFFEDVFGLEE